VSLVTIEQRLTEQRGHATRVYPLINVALFTIESNMSDDGQEFDWSPLGEAWWRDAAGACGASDKQAKFACLRHRGMTAVGAARGAGYGGEGASIRQLGSRTAKSPAVLNLLAMAAAEAGGGTDGTVDTPEAKRILSRLARGSDPNVRIKALDSLAKLEERERESNTSEDPGDLNEIVRRTVLALPASLGPALAVGMWFEWLGDIEGFPFLREVAPLLAHDLPEEWARWRGDKPNPRLDELAAGPVLSSDELVAALRKSVRVKKLNGSHASAEQPAYA
jgi:hypothetical protein